MSGLLLEQEAAALRQGANITALAGAIMKLSGPDLLEASCGIVTIAQVLVRGDPVGRAVLARIMIDVARELDPDVFDTTLQ